MNDPIDAIMHIMVRAFSPRYGEAWTRKQISDSLTFPNTEYDLVSVKGDNPKNLKESVGFTLVRFAPGEEELLLVAVLPEFRKSGLGRQLVLRCAERAQKRGADKIFLEMRANNPARALYEALGFTPIGDRKEYYTLYNGNTLDAITFAKQL